MKVEVDPPTDGVPGVQFQTEKFESIHPASIQSTMSTQERAERMLTWLKKNGGHVHPSAELRNGERLVHTPLTPT